MNFILNRRKLLKQEKQNPKSQKLQKINTGDWKGNFSPPTNDASPTAKDPDMQCQKKTTKAFKPEVRTPVEGAFKRNECSAPALIPIALLTPSNRRSSARKVGYNLAGESLYAEKLWEVNPFKFSCL